MDFRENNDCVYDVEGKDEEQKLRLFNDGSIRDKDQLISRLIADRKETKRMAENDRDHSFAHYMVVDRLYDMLINKIKAAVLFNKLEDWWAYSYSINKDGATVKLEHFGDASFNDKGQLLYGYIDQSFVVVSIPCRLLTVEEYAWLHKVETGTVRQWIRRGKIRTAKKFGNEWRIPELTDLPQRGYKFGQYKWEDNLSEVPEEYEYLKEPAIASFSQDSSDPKLFHVRIDRLKGNGKELLLTMREREKLELFLIANPMVHYLTDLESYG